jgi:hypothetical protein
VVTTCVPVEEVVEVTGKVVGVVVVLMTVVLDSVAVGTVVGVGTASSQGHKTQIPTARPTTMRPATSRRITSASNLRSPTLSVKGPVAEREKSWAWVRYG